MPIDLRTRKLAKFVADAGISVKPGEKVMLSGGIESIPFLVELYKEIILKKAYPLVRVGLPDVSDFYYKYATKEQLEHFPQITMDVLKKVDKYVGVNSELNTKEFANCDPKKIMGRQKVTAPLSHYVCDEKDKIRRCTVAYPCLALAQEAEMSLTEYENFVYGACLQDWGKIGKQMMKILKIFKKGKSVHLIGEGVDLKFKIHGEKITSDLDGDNIPMGEVFMAPIRESLNGWIKFEYPITDAAKHISDVKLKFKDGKVMEYDASKNKDLLREILETDENSSYVGEFGIGMNPKIENFVKDLLFDEKIGGTIHLALGRAYKENGGGNDSAVHTDIVKDMKNAKIILDGKVVQDNGKWKVRGVKL